MRAFLLALIVPLASCGAVSALPKDPEGALERIRSTHVLRAGISHNPPWTRTQGGEPSGVEADLVRGFAYSLRARVEWTENGEQPLLEGLGKQQLDLVAAGGTTKSPWKKTVGVSQSYATSPTGEKQVVFAAAGENGLLLALDRFIYGHRDAYAARAAEKARR
jgi:polar amino acid transport system substrate-binding protein